MSLLPPNVSRVTVIRARNKIEQINPPLRHKSRWNQIAAEVGVSIGTVYYQR